MESAGVIPSLYCLVLGLEHEKQHLFYYISEKCYFYEEMVQTNFQHVMAYLECWVLKAQEIINILALEVKPPYQEKGMAAMLLDKLKKIAKTCQIEKICTDDMSSRSHQLAGNLWVKHGFRLLDRSSGPEMVLAL